MLLEPFAHHTNIASADKSTTIGMVIPILKELELHLEDVSENIQCTEIIVNH